MPAGTWDAAKRSIRATPGLVAGGQREGRGPTLAPAESSSPTEVHSAGTAFTTALDHWEHRQQHRAGDQRAQSPPELELAQAQGRMPLRRLAGADSGTKQWRCGFCARLTAKAGSEQVCTGRSMVTCMVRRTRDHRCQSSRRCSSRCRRAAATGQTVELHVRVRELLWSSSSR